MCGVDINNEYDNDIDYDDGDDMTILMMTTHMAVEAMAALVHRVRIFNCCLQRKSFSLKHCSEMSSNDEEDAIFNPLLGDQRPSTKE